MTLSIAAALLLAQLLERARPAEARGGEGGRSVVKGNKNKCPRLSKLQ